MTLTYFVTSDIHLNDGFGPLSAYTAVVRLPTTMTTAAFLVIIFITSGRLDDSIARLSNNGYLIRIQVRQPRATVVG